MKGGTVIKVDNLVKTYKGDVKAVAGITLDVNEGEFFGLLGPNGAGKTTILKILATLLAKTAGAVHVAGFEVTRDAQSVRRSIGFAMQEIGLDDLATGREHLIFQGLLYHLPRQKAKQRAEELLALIGLEDVANRRVGTYSGGMRRRLDLACAMVHSPRLLFLDEPTTGLDPQSRLAIWEYLEKLNRGGMTILLTTQYMEEADRLCRRLAIIDRGLIVAMGSPESLKAEIGADVLTIRPKEAAGAGIERVQTLLADRPYVSGIKAADGAVTVFARNGASVLPEMLRHLGEHSVEVASVNVASPTLEDVFLKVTGHTIRSEDATRDVMAGMIRMYGRG